MPTKLQNPKTPKQNPSHNSLLQTEQTKLTDEQSSQSNTTKALNVIDINLDSTTQPNQIEIAKPVNKTIKNKISLGKKISFSLILLSIILLGFGTFLGFNSFSQGANPFGNGSNLSFWEQLTNITGALTNQRKPIAGEEQGRTNVLIIGRDAIGSGLTDTIMIGSYFHKEKKFVTLSIPRDFYVSDGFGSYKINALFPFAEQNEQGSGEKKLAEFITKEYGIEIHYWASINFEGLVKVIDELGGITVNVDNEFTDCLYPNSTNGYIRPCPTFKAGEVNMNGTTALIYARSRQGSNGEGSDFARARRQSKVIQAIAEKAKLSNIVLNVSKIQTYFEILGGTLRTNARVDEILSASMLRDEFDPSNGFYRIVWDNSNGILCDNSSADGVYILTYCDGSIAGRRGSSLVRDKAKSQVQNMLFVAQSEGLLETKISIIGNGSNDSTTVYNDLINAGFKNVTINNAYNKISPATSKSVEKVSIYIKDQKLRDQFKTVSLKQTLNTEILETLPETKIPPTQASSSSIIIWVESVN